MGKKIILVFVVVLLLVSVVSCVGNVNYEDGLVVDKYEEESSGFLSSSRYFTLKVVLTDDSVVEIRGYKICRTSEVGEEIWLRVVRNEDGKVMKVVPSRR